MPILSSVKKLLQDPPPDLVFEIAPEGVRFASRSNPGGTQFRALTPGAISPSPLRDNVLLPDVFSEAVRTLAPRDGKKHTTALLLPDYCAHIAVIDFDKLPDKTEERLALIRFRVRKSVPFDLDSAALSYWIQPAATGSQRDVVVAVTALEIISRYEAPFRAMGLHPGLVTLSPLTALDLIDRKGMVVLARICGSALTILVQKDGVLKLVRSLDLNINSLEEIAEDLHPTFAYIEDNLEASAQFLYLAGFGDLTQGALSTFPEEFGVPVESLGGTDTGMQGYLKGLAA